METRLIANVTGSATSPTAKGSHSALTSSSLRGAPTSATACVIAVQYVESNSTVLLIALADRRDGLGSPVCVLVHKYLGVLSILQHRVVIGTADKTLLCTP